MNAYAEVQFDFYEISNTPSHPHSEETHLPAQLSELVTCCP